MLFPHHFPNVKRSHVDIGDATGEAFAGLPEQIDGSRAEYEEPAGAMTAAAALVNQAAQRLEYFRRAVDFIENDQPVLIGAQKKRRLDQLVPVLRRLQIEIERVGALRDCQGERRLADLTRANEGNGGFPIQGCSNRRESVAWDHPCKLSK